VSSFDTIPHADLLKSVARRSADRHVLRLIKLWLKAPIEERDGNGKRRMSGGKNGKCGTPQGGVATPPTILQNYPLTLGEGATRAAAAALRQWLWRGAVDGASASG
jgi:hypothetical protein